jgi:hypothetical protein
MFKARHREPASTGRVPALAQAQYLTVIFDRDDRVESKSIRTVRDIIYQD